MGSLFIRRLHSDISQSTNSSFERDYGLGVDVSYICKGGWKLKDVRENMVSIIAIAPDYVIMQCGANDLCDHRHGETVGMQMLEVAKEIKERSTAKEVVIGQSLNRRVGRYLKNPAQADQFNQNAKRANIFVKGLAGEYGVIYWRHRGLTCPEEGGKGDTLCKDGVHLSNRGQYKYFKSIKGAIVNMRNRHKVPSKHGKKQA